MLVALSPLQCRIIGVLLEKEVTTADQYPLSLNGLTLGCNQKSSRDPIMALSESQVQQGIDELIELKQVTQVSGFGSRVAKYQHRFCNTEFGDLQLTAQQKAIICVLLLRGPQTPGELRTRCGRLAEFTNAEQVEQCLTSMQSLNAEQLVVKLEREPGKREARFMHTFCTEELAELEQLETPTATTSQVNVTLQQRVETLETLVEQLQQKLANLEARLAHK